MFEDEEDWEDFDDEDEDEDDQKSSAEFLNPLESKGQKNGDFQKNWIFYIVFF